LAKPSNPSRFSFCCTAISAPKQLLPGRFLVNTGGNALTELKQSRTVFFVIAAALVIFIASPVLEPFFVAPQTPLTEMWLLGPNRDAIYPSNVTSGQNIRLYMDVRNNLGSSAQYEAQLKFRSASQSAPDSFTLTNSKLPALDTLTFSVADKATHEVPLDVSFNYVVSGGSERIQMQFVSVNGKAISLDSTSIVYDQSRGGFFGNLFIELYIYSSTQNTFVYHQRYVSLWLQLL
jgi:hypothetical protein